MKQRLLLLVMAFPLTLVACGPLKGHLLPTPLASQTSDSTGPSVQLVSAAKVILRDRCAVCHGEASSGPGGVYNITDAQHLIQMGHILPGKASQSPLMQSIDAGRMPTSGSLPESEVTTLRNWINQMATTPPPSTPTPQLEAKFSSILNRILIPKCVTCHGPTTQYASIRLDSYTAAIKTVVVGSPSTSSLFTSCQSKAMPPSSAGYSPLSSEELAAISNWITAGAVNN